MPGSQAILNSTTNNEMHLTFEVSITSVLTEISRYRKGPTNSAKQDPDMKQRATRIYTRVINIVSMHRSIIIIRSNTQRLERLSGASFPIITPKGLPPAGNSTWGCTTFASPPLATLLFVYPRLPPPPARSSPPTLFRRRFFSFAFNFPMRPAIERYKGRFSSTGETFVSLRLEYSFGEGISSYRWSNSADIIFSAGPRYWINVLRRTVPSFQQYYSNKRNRREANILRGAVLSWKSYVTSRCAVGVRRGVEEFENVET